MSLLDDVSLMITPNGVAEDVLFGVLPEPIIGVELVTNGDFATDSDWNGSKSISGGQLTKTTSGLAYQSGVVTEGKVYQVTVDVASLSGTAQIYAGGNNSSSLVIGVQTVYITAGATNNFIGFNNGYVGSEGTVYNSISVKEYTSADMDFTRATTATFVNNTGIIQGTSAGIPRLDYRVSESCPHILVEPQRTNICLRNITLGNATWTKQNVTVTNNSTTSPDGTVNAEKVAKDGVSADDKIEQTITISNSTEYSISAFLKNNDNPTGGKTTLAYRVSGGTLFRKGYEWTGASLAATTTYASGTRTNEFIEDYGNGWYRVGFSFTSDGTSGDFEIDVDRSGGTSTTSIYAWGCQLEEGGFKTSYIETSTASVTRNGEVFERTGIADLINSAEGVLFIEMAALADSGIHRQISLNDGTNDNRVSIGLSNSSNIVSAQVVSGGAFQANKTNAMTQTNFNKIALKWKANDMALWLNGSEVATDSSVTVPIGLDTLDFNRGDDANWFFGKVRQIQVYKTALSDTQLGALTT